MVPLALEVTVVLSKNSALTAPGSFVSLWPKGLTAITP